MSESTESVIPAPIVSDKPEAKPNDDMSSGEKKYINDLIRYKKENEEFKSQLEAIALEKETKKGNFQGVISKLKDDLATSKRSNEEMKLNFASNTLDDAIRQEALSKGIKGQQLDVFMKLVDDDAKGIVEFDESFNVKKEDVNTLVDDHLKRYSDVFKSKVNVVDGTPNNKPHNTNAGKFNLGNATAKETLAYMLKNQDKLK